MLKIYNILYRLKECMRRISWDGKFKQAQPIEITFRKERAKGQEVPRLDARRIGITPEYLYRSC